MAPSLQAGFTLDDHFVRVSDNAAWDLYRVGDHGPLHLSEGIEQGLLPWWTPSEAGLSMFRPVTSLTVAAERALWPESPWLMHLANLVLFGALVLAVGALYRRIQQGPAWIAGLATVLFALDDAHGMPVGWLSGRHLIIGTLLGVLALLAHDRWRRDGWVVGAVLGPVLAGLATASSEVGGCVAAYFLAYALLLQHDRAPSWRRIMAALGPIGAVGLVRIGSVIAGYGLWGTQIGNDPLRDPLAFLAGVPDRFSALTFGGWGWVPSDLWILVPPGEGRGALIVAAAVFIAMMVWSIYPVARRSDTLRFWAGGSVLSMVAICDVFPQDRLLMMVGVGAFGVIAQFIGSFLDHPEWWRPGFWFHGRARFLAWAWVIIHVGVASLLLVPRSVSTQLLSSSFERLVDELPISAHGKDVVVVRAPDAWSAGATPVIARSRGTHTARRVYVLYAGAGALDITGTPDGIQIEPTQGFFADSLASAYLGAKVPDTARLGPLGLTYHGDRLDVEPTGPVEWVLWSEAGYAPFSVPAVGDTRRIPAVDLAAAFAPRNEAENRP